MRMMAAVLAAGLAATAVTAQDVVPPAPLTDRDFRQIDEAEARLGWLLFYDPILSGNREVACATCHHPAFATGDGVSLGIGDGGRGLGPDRDVDPANPPEQRIPRNAPPLFNVGLYPVLFHDGRIERDPTKPGGIRTPLGQDMVAGFASLLSAQTMFPVLSADEMAGHYTENEIARAVRQGLITGEDGAWTLIADRVAAIPAYAEAFARVYPHIDGPEDIAFTDISNAIATFMEWEWRSDASAFDAWTRGEAPLPEEARAGAALFYGEAGCGGCHAGPLLTDFAYHAMGAPQIGPGKAARFERHARDEGRFRVTGREEDLYAFRTPSLRNVTETGPWGHAGAHDDLGAFIAAHADPAAGLAAWTPDEAVLPEMEVDDLWARRTPGEWEAIAAAVLRPATPLTAAQIDDLLAFLETLDDPVALDGRFGVPETVPSGLPVPRP